MKNNKWKRISALLLAVCMIASLMLSGNVPGVFALEDTESADHITVEENTEKTETEEFSTEKETEDKILDNGKETDKSKITSETEAKIIESIAEETIDTVE